MSVRILLPIFLAFTACAKSAEPPVITRIEYVEVAVPQPCDLPMPTLTRQTGDPVVDMLSIEQFIYELQATLEGCNPSPKK